MTTNNDWGYDIETYPNYFSVGFEHNETGEYRYYEVSTRRNDILQLREFLDYLAATNARTVGFNNQNFDYPVIHETMVTDPYQVTLDQIYGKAMSIINSNNRFGTMWESDHLITQIDLYKLNHYDNANKRTSLKQLEFAMRMENIRDLPFAPGSVLTPEQMDVTADYMRHDIAATRMFHNENKKAIQLREALSETYGVNMLNYSDSKIGSTILVKRLNEAGIETHEYIESWDDATQSVKRKKQAKGTHRPSLNLGEVVFPYVRFERPEFNAVLNWLHKTTITKTKGALELIPYDPDLFQYMDPYNIVIPGLTAEDVDHIFKPVRNRNTRYSTVLEKGAIIDLADFPGVRTNKSQDGGNLHVIVDGFRYDFGTGGIHGSVESQVVRSDDEYVILDYDFASWYPHLSFVNGVYPEHLGIEFCTIYEGMYHDRKAIPKSDPNNYALKIALNGSYGNSNSVYSPFYDPKFTMTITINGQLILCMLAEQLIKTPGLNVIQVNTDGITVRVPRRHIEHVRAVVAWIEKVSGVAMEEARYSRMMIKNVNAYIAEYASYEYLHEGVWKHQNYWDKKDRDKATKGLPKRELIGVTGGDLKRKKDYQLREDREWHKDHSALIIAMAAEAALVRGEDVRAFIENHTDIFDFMILAKVRRNEKLMLGDREIQRVSRVYVSLSGERLVIHRPPKGDKTEWKTEDKIKDRLLSEANDINDASFDDIDYDYYVEEAEKLVKPLLK